MCPLPNNLEATLVLEPYDNESLKKFQLITDRLLKETKGIPYRAPEVYEREDNIKVSKSYTFGWGTKFVLDVEIPNGKGGVEVIPVLALLEENAPSTKYDIGDIKLKLAYEEFDKHATEYVAGGKPIQQLFFNVELRKYNKDKKCQPR